MSLVHSVKNGAAAAARRLVVDATAPTSAPTVDDGSAGERFRGGDWAHVFAHIKGPDDLAIEAVVRPWYYSDVPARWYAGCDVTFKRPAEGPTTEKATIETRGASRIALQLISITAGGRIDLWAGYNFDGYLGERG